MLFLFSLNKNNMIFINKYNGITSESKSKKTGKMPDN